MKAGDCIQQNILAGNPPFQRCGGYDVWSDTGTADENHCFFPSLHALDEIFESYPNATILMVIRNSKDWLESISRWRKGKLKSHLRNCTFPNFEFNPNDLISFYDRHTEAIRSFAREHPSMTYIEVDLEAPETALILEARIGIPAFCWRHCHPDQVPYCPSQNITEGEGFPWNL